MTTSRIGRASEVTADGPLQKIPGNTAMQRTLGQMTAVVTVPSPALPVDQAAIGTFLVPFDAEIIGGWMRTLTQQITANGSAVVNVNGSAVGTIPVLTASTAGTLTPVTVGADQIVTAANAKLNAGDVITFTRPDTGASGVVAVTLVLVPRA